VPEAALAFRSLPARGFDRSRPWTLVSAVLVAMVSSVRAWRLLRELKPDVVIGFGAYVSLPVGFAALVRGVPLVLHEQNSVPGMANKVLSRWAARVCVTYEESGALLAHPDRSVMTGNPVRAEVLSADRSRGRSKLGLAEDDVVLLSFGGSRGARHLNTALVALRDRLLAIDKLVVLQVTGAGEFDAVRGALEAVGGDAGGRWRVFDYLPGMGSAIAASDLVVSRAGATTIAELTALGAPAIVVPYPYATDDHQTRNAAALLVHGAALLVRDADLDDPGFGEALLTLLSDPPARATMAAASRALGRPDAAERVAAVAHDVVRARESS